MPPNPKTNPNPNSYRHPNRGAIFLGGNCPETIKSYVEFKKAWSYF